MQTRAAPTALRATVVAGVIVLAVALAAILSSVLTPPPVDTSVGVPLTTLRPIPTIAALPTPSVAPRTPAMGTAQPTLTPDGTPAASPTRSPTPTRRPSPSPTGASPGPSPTDGDPVVHIVQPGENLTQISLQYGVTVPALVAANAIADPNTIFVGQALVIPPSE